MIPGNNWIQRSFLAAFAAANEKYEVGKVFFTYSDNDEYMCTCPDCDREYYVWNKDNSLIMYKEDPLFGKAICPECGGDFEVFDGVIGPLG